MQQIDSAQKKKYVCGMDMHEGTVPPPVEKKRNELSFTMVFDECRKMTDEDWNTVLAVMKTKWPNVFESSDKKIEVFSERNMYILWVITLVFFAVGAIFLGMTVKPEWFIIGGFLLGSAWFSTKILFLWKK